MGQIDIPGVGQLPVNIDVNRNGLDIQINTPFGRIPVNRDLEQRTNAAGNSSVTGPDGSPIQTSAQVQSLIQEMKLSNVQVAQRGSLTEIKLQSPELGNVSVVVPNIPNRSESDLLTAVLPQIRELDSQIAGKLDTLAIQIQQNGTSLNMRAVASRDGRQVEQGLQGVPFNQLQQGSQQLGSALNQALQASTVASQTSASPVPTSSPTTTDQRFTQALDRLRAMGFVDVEKTLSRSGFSTSPEGMAGVAGRLVLTDGREIPFSYQLGSLSAGWTPEAAEAVVVNEMARVVQLAESVPNLSAQVLSIRRQNSGGMSVQFQTGEQRLVTSPFEGIGQVQAAIGTAAQNSARNPLSPPLPVTTQIPQQTAQVPVPPVAQTESEASPTVPIPVVPPTQRTPVLPENSASQSSDANSANRTTANTRQPVNPTPTPVAQSVGAQLNAAQRAQALRALVEASELRDDARKGQITLTRENGQGGENVLSFFRQKDGTVMVVHIDDQGKQRMYGGDPVVVATYDSNGNLVRGQAIPQLDEYLRSFVSFRENGAARLSLSEGSHLRSVMSSEFLG